MAEERLQKILSQAGVASRRQAEQMMVAGRVTVNGAVVTELGSKADLERDHIKVDGRLIHAPKRLIYIVLNKPNNTPNKQQTLAPYHKAALPYARNLYSDYTPQDDRYHAQSSDQKSVV